MKKTLLIIIALTTVFLNQIIAQSYDQISLTPGYLNQSFYSLENGEAANIDNSNWDLAFATATMSSSIRINGGMGTELYSYPLGDTTDWNTFNYTSISSWNPVYNSDTNWFIGAFDKHSLSTFDMGWGIYSMITHYVTGDSLYAIKTVNGNWKKLWVKELASGIYEFIYADLDGSNEVTAQVDKANFSGRNFAYYSLDQNTSINREPSSADWDITFTKYITPVQGMPYGVTGVLSNSGIKVAQANNLSDPFTYSDYNQHSMSTEINAIGYDWKDFDMSSFSYVLNQNRCYFVKDLNNKIWRIVFTQFEGSSSGDIEFNKQDLSSSTSSNNLNSEISSFTIYPNPTNIDATIIYDNNGKQIEINIYDLTGKNIYSEIAVGSSLQAKIIPTSNLKAGIYIVQITSDGISSQKKLMIQ